MPFSLPKATLSLVKSPLTKDNEHQIFFANETEQQTYFNSLPNEFILYNYVRNEGYIHVPLSYYDILKYNYLIFQNTYVNNKWFFCFIDRLEYVTEQSTKIYIKTDVFQTYQFDISYHKSFIERRHETVDYLNSVQDLVSSGSLVVNSETEVSFTGLYLVFCNSDITHLDLSTSSSTYNFNIGIYQLPCMVLCYKETDTNLMNADLQVLANSGVADRINSCVYLPCVGDVDKFIIENVASDITGGDVPVCTGISLLDSFEVLSKDVELDFSSVSLSHLKSLTSPYAKIIVQDKTTGQTIELEPNKFLNKKATFRIQVSISETPSYRIIPLQYNGNAKSYSDSLVVKCNTSLPIANSTYAKYLMNNADMNGLKILGSTIGGIGGVATGSAMGVYSGFEGITNVMLQQQQASRQPNELTSITDGAFERLLFQSGIRIILMTMDEPNQQACDTYWNMFGYPVKTLDYINPSSLLDRQFIKTIGANITGNFPQNDLIEIQDIFNKGVTLWKSSNFRLY